MPHPACRRCAAIAALKFGWYALRIVTKKMVAEHHKQMLQERAQAKSFTKLCQPESSHNPTNMKSTGATRSIFVRYCHWGTDAGTGRQVHVLEVTVADGVL